MAVSTPHIRRAAAMAGAALLAVSLTAPAAAAGTAGAIPASQTSTSSQFNTLADEGYSSNGSTVIDSRTVNPAAATGCNPPANLYLPDGIGGADGCTFDYMRDIELYPKSTKSSAFTRGILNLGGGHQLFELQQARGLSGTVRTAGDEYPGDGAGMTYTVTSTRPTDETANVAMPLADGQWAVPQGFASAPSTQSNAAATEDLINRGQTFVDAGTQLQWDASRPTPLTGKVIHSVNSAPPSIPPPTP